MSLPFTTDEFLAVFQRYNDAVWPAQWALAALGVVAVALAARRRSGRAVAVILAFLWAWMGLVYHIGFFTAINPMATVFGVLFIVQALMFARAAISDGAFAFDVRADARGFAGALLVAYALVAYPLLGRLAGHEFPRVATFGLPCPTTILTIGLLLWAGPGVPRVLFLVPVLWSAIGGSAVGLLGMHEDAGLLVAGLAGAWAALGCV
jgi:hypothetical protein